MNQFLLVFSTHHLRSLLRAFELFELDTFGPSARDLRNDLQIRSSIKNFSIVMNSFGHGVIKDHEFKY